MRIARFWILLFVFGLGVLVADLAKASPVFDNGEIRVTLLETECASALPFLTFEMNDLTGSKEAKVVIRGIDVEACWVPWEGRILISDENGASGFLELSQFQDR